MRPLSFPDTDISAKRGSDAILIKDLKSPIGTGECKIFQHGTRFVLRIVIYYNDIKYARKVASINGCKKLQKEPFSVSGRNDDGKIHGTSRKPPSNI